MKKLLSLLLVTVMLLTVSCTPDDTDTTKAAGTQTSGTLPSGGPGEPTPGYTYNDFTPAEKNLFTQYIGTVIPFAPNNEYYVEGYYEETDYKHGMSFYTFGNTAEDFAAYRALYEDYTLTDTYTDGYGDPLAYTFVVDSITEDTATVTFTKR